MSEFQARISRVRMKDGASVSVLHNPKFTENMQGLIVNHARQIAGHSDGEGRLDGFIVIGLFSDGKTSMGYRLPERIPQCLAPGYITELVRRDVVVGTEAERTFDDKFEWVE